MKKSASGIACLLALPFLLSGCGAVGSKSLSLPVIYAASSLLGVCILVGYACFSKKINQWLLLLLVCVTVVNTGYFMLSVSSTLEMALWSNRISYLGSVFLPFTMLMSIMDVCKLKRPKWMIPALLSVGAIVFLIAASPGILDIYYKEVTLGIVDGVYVLQKVYGPLHSIYLYYLVAYFSCMVAVIVYARHQSHSVSISYAVLLLIATLINIAVWLLEQLVDIEFEFLSVSYIISELFLFGLHIAMTENERLKKLVMIQDEVAIESKSEQTLFSPDFQKETPENEELRKDFFTNLSTLTKTERMIFDFYVEGKTTKEVLKELSITENTLKFHNKNIYSKFNVPSRKKLLQIYNEIK